MSVLPLGFLYSVMSFRAPIQPSSFDCFLDCPSYHWAFCTEWWVSCALIQPSSFYCSLDCPSYHWAICTQWCASCALIQPSSFDCSLDCPSYYWVSCTQWWVSCALLQPESSCFSHSSNPTKQAWSFFSESWSFQAVSVGGGYSRSKIIKNALGAIYYTDLINLFN